MSLYIQQSHGPLSDVKSPHQLGCRASIVSRSLLLQLCCHPTSLSGAALIAVVTPSTHPMANLSMENWCHSILTQHIHGEMW